MVSVAGGGRGGLVGCSVATHFGDVFLVFGVWCLVVDLEEEEMGRMERRAWENEAKGQLRLENIANGNHHQGAEGFIDIPICGRRSERRSKRCSPCLQ